MRDHRSGVNVDAAEVDITSRVRWLASLGQNYRWRPRAAGPADRPKPKATTIGRGARGGKAGKILRGQQ